MCLASVPHPQLSIVKPSIKFETSAESAISFKPKACSHWAIDYAKQSRTLLIFYGQSTSLGVGLENAVVLWDDRKPKLIVLVLTKE